ncbi:MAG: hypothetical protein KAZ85_01955 [Gammaproteobacteria bacterium]|nr:hypothetical protein [Gammaproteobacteria bacterium]
MLRSLFFISLAIIVQGCASNPLPPEASQQNLGKLTVHNPIVIDSEKARVSVQAGRVVDRIDRSEAVCSFESWLKADTTQTIQPDIFRISQLDERHGDVSQGFGFYGSNDASIGVGVGFRLGGIGLGVGPMGYPYDMRDGQRVAQALVQMRLVSSKQPMIYRLTCYSAEGWMGSVDVPSEAQINQILNGIATVELMKQ